MKVLTLYRARGGVIRQVEIFQMEFIFAAPRVNEFRRNCCHSESIKDFGEEESVPAIDELCFY
jgi:hypothetical protein